MSTHLTLYGDNHEYRRRIKARTQAAGTGGAGCTTRLAPDPNFRSR
jgi:hypothetical protein